MTPGTFTRCRECQRLLIYGQTCTCGNRTNGQETRRHAVTILPLPTDPHLGRRAAGQCTCGQTNNGPARDVNEWRKNHETTS